MEASEAHLKVKSDILTNKYGQCAYGRTGGTDGLTDKVICTDRVRLPRSKGP